MKELELYLHIPFCVQKCRYCDFLSVPGCPQEIEAYVCAMLQEIRAYHGKYDDYMVTSVFFGGGTPSLLSAEQMNRLMDAVRRAFSIEESAEISMEMNPGTVTMEKLNGYREAGINRLSIGLQSVNDEELKMLGRIHNYSAFLQTYEMARKAGFRNINVDLISAIPGQTVESWRKTLRTVADLKPEHISAYSLIIEEGTPFYEIYGEKADFAESVSAPELQLPDEESERQMYEDTRDILLEYGYHRYEISNYAKEGYECRHNLGYWERKEYLGLGTGAASLIGTHRFNHIQDTAEYLKISGNPEQLVCDREALSMKEEMEEFMFLGLRKMKGIQTEMFLQNFNCSVESVYGAEIGTLVEEGLLAAESNRIYLTEKGIDISNYVLSHFLLD